MKSFFPTYNLECMQKEVSQECKKKLIRKIFKNKYFDLNGFSDDKEKHYKQFLIGIILLNLNV